MKIMSSITFIFLGFAGMEIFSYFFHKYVMHGPLWNIHKTHHVCTEGFLEWNDVFSFIFGAIATSLIILGGSDLNYGFWTGIGITAYGLSYFVLHDVFIHKRVKFIKKLNNSYFKAIHRAHLSHHKSIKKEAVSFGLLWVPRKYFKR